MSILRSALNITSKILSQTVQKHVTSRPMEVLLKPLVKSVQQPPVNHLHILTRNPLVTQLLTPTSHLLTPTCGFKVKGRLRRRCKDCYFIRRQDRLLVLCKTHQRHKQMSMVKKEHNTWVLTSATQGKIRPW